MMLTTLTAPGLYTSFEAFAKWSRKSFWIGSFGAAVAMARVAVGTKTRTAENCNTSDLKGSYYNEGTVAASGLPSTKSFLASRTHTQYTHSHFPQCR